ncbi:MAG: preprotein translocase subunit SecG [Candidatus Omnitrophica bacterium]|nr:preprotein translocase subunit SecG [Candidatus Omnitrophota bacterium]
MYLFVIVIHTIACLILIASILLQTGRGGGISDLFGGGGTSQTLFGTRASTFLVRATTTAAIVFLLTCITLTVFSSKRFGSSVMSGVEESDILLDFVDEPVVEEEAAVSEPAILETQDGTKIEIEPGEEIRESEPLPESNQE